MRDDNPLRIGELAERLELNPRTLRYWEQIGITPPPDRTDGGYRTYGADDEHRLRFIKDARHLGFTLGEIKEILVLRDQGQAPCQYVTALLHRRISEIDRTISALARLKTELCQLERRSPNLPRSQPPTGYCHILESQPAA